MFSYAPPDAGAIVYTRYHHAMNSTELITRLRVEKSVLIVPGDHFGMDHYLRLGFGDDPDHLTQGLSRLARSPVLDLILIGYGNVARRFASLLDEQRDTLLRDYGLRARIVGIATRQHGSHARRTPGHSRRPLARSFATRFERSAAAARQRRLVVIETTTLDIASGEPAIGHVRAALAGGAHVITANKGPVAFAYGALRRAAQRADRRFLFEGAVMDGVPIFNLVRETLPALNVLGFRGVVNSTTNFILTAMEAWAAVRGGARRDAGAGRRGGRCVARRRRLGCGSQDRGACQRAAGREHHSQGRGSARHRA